MQASQAPIAFVAPFANSAGAGYIRSIPTNSQIGITAGAASLQTGFPPVCFVPVAAGGTPPWGQDTNGILNQVTAGVQWSQVGGEPLYNSAFSTAIGGYPNGAILQSADGTGFWRSTVDNNGSNPDTGGANWLPMFFSTSASIALTNANVTLSAVQYSKPIIVLTGTLTGPVALTFPAFVQQWTVINSTIGSFAVTALTSGGVPVTLAQGGKTALRGNGTNVVVDPLQVADGISPNHAASVEQLNNRKQIFTSSGSFTSPNGVTTMYLSGCAAGGGGGSGGPGSISSTSAWAGGGGGGGAGQPLQRAAVGVTAGTIISVTIGAAGVGGTASGNNPGNSGTAGGNTVISGAGFNGGVAITLIGGIQAAGGFAATSGNAVGGAAGAGFPAGGFGNDTTNGNASGSGGTGASGPFGGGGGAARSSTTGGVAGGAAYGFGAGGGGGSGVYFSGAGNGGSGGNAAPGYMAFEW